MGRVRQAGESRGAQAAGPLSPSAQTHIKGENGEGRELYWILFSLHIEYELGVPDMQGEGKERAGCQGSIIAILQKKQIVKAVRRIYDFRDLCESFY